jgi:hypothetical protein
MTPYWKARLGILLVFVLGGMAGALLMFIVLHHRTVQFFQRPAALVEVLQRRLTRHLRLTADQKEQIHAAFMVNLSQRRLLQAQIKPQIKALNQQTVGQIEAILTPDQLVIFSGNLDELHRERAFQTEVPNADTLTNAPVGTPPAKQ